MLSDHLIFCSCSPHDSLSKIASDDLFPPRHKRSLVGVFQHGRGLQLETVSQPEFTQALARPTYWNIFLTPDVAPIRGAGESLASSISSNSIHLH